MKKIFFCCLLALSICTIAYGACPHSGRHHAGHCHHAHATHHGHHPSRSY